MIKLFITTLLFSMVAAIAVPRPRSSIVQLRSATGPPCLETFPKGLNFFEAQNVATNNVGNMVIFGSFVWKHAAPRLFNVDQTEFQCILYTDLADDANQQDKSAVLYPTANWIFNASDADTAWNQQQKKGADYLKNLFQNVNLPVFIIGVGVQADFEGGGPSDFLMDASQVAVFQTVQQKTPVIAARGQYTAAVLRANGIHGAVALGCPSLFWNHNPELGRVIEAKLRSLKDIPEQELRVGITLFLRPNDNNIGNLVNILDRFPKSVIILQANGDMNVMYHLEKALGGKLPDSRVTYFYDPYTWQEDLKNFDLVLGHRIHGSMMSLAAETPMIVFPQDHRIQELAETMKLPIIAAKEFDVQEFDIYKAVEQVPFNGAAFDCNRRSIGMAYRDWFATAGLSVHPGISNIYEADLKHKYRIVQGRVVTDSCNLLDGIPSDGINVVGDDDLFNMAGSSSDSVQAKGEGHESSSALNDEDYYI